MGDRESRRKPDYLLDPLSIETHSTNHLLLKVEGFFIGRHIVNNDNQQQRWQKRELAKLDTILSVTITALLSVKSAKSLAVFDHLPRLHLKLKVLGSFEN